MTIAHHPSDFRLLDYAAGRLDEGQRLLVATHLAICSTCDREVAMLERVGGALLAAIPPTPLEPDARDRILARLDVLTRDEAIASRDQRPPDMPELPEALRPYPLGPWNWAGPGVHWRALRLNGESASRVFLLRAAPGKHLPQHTHSGTELTLVLRGAFSHEGGRFAAGDFEDADDSIEHRPIVDSDEECLCLVAMDGKLLISGLMGKVMQPFVRF